MERNERIKYVADFLIKKIKADDEMSKSGMKAALVAVDLAADFVIAAFNYMERKK